MASGSQRSPTSVDSSRSNSRASLGSSAVRFEQRGPRLVLSKLNLDFRASDEAPLAPVVASSFPDSPVFSAKLQAPSDDPDALLIDASDLFGPDLYEVLPSSTGFSPAENGAQLVDLCTRAVPIHSQASHLLMDAHDVRAPLRQR